MNTQNNNHIRDGDSRRMTGFDDLINSARCYWRENGLGDFDFVLLLPDEDEAYNERVRVAFETKLRDGCGISGISIDGEAARLLVLLHSLYDFSGAVLIGSFDEPFGRKLRNLLDCAIATEAELINDVILGVMDGKRV